jgi:3-mercaptopyruvate sulfurtransferase SseA
MARHIEKALRATGGRIEGRGGAAALLEINPHTLRARMRKMGIGDGNRVVVYDSQGVFSSARVWWTLRLMGHEDVVVLDGGLPKWLAEGRPTEDMPPPPRDRHFTARYHSDLVRDYNQVLRVLGNGREQVLDARPAGRFTGEVPEPRPGLRGGHMPGAHNLPAGTLSAADGTFVGLVLGAVETRYFTEFYRAIQLGRANAISLFRSDGTLLARFPEADEAIGRSIGNSATFLQVTTTSTFTAISVTT